MNEKEWLDHLNDRHTSTTVFQRVTTMKTVIAFLSFLQYTIGLVQCAFGELESAIAKDQYLEGLIF